MPLRGIGLLLRLRIGRLRRRVLLALLALPILGLLVLRLSILRRLRRRGLILAVLFALGALPILPVLASVLVVLFVLPGLILAGLVLTGLLLVFGLALAVLVVLLLTLARRIHRRTIGDGVLLVGVLLQRTVVRRNRFVVLPLPGQRVAKVVQALIGGHTFKRFLCRSEIAFAIRLHACIQTLLLHLIGALPQRTLCCVRGPSQRQHTHQREYRHNRTTAERQQRQQHHRQQQPVAFVQPGLAAIGLGRFIGQGLLRRIEHPQRTQIRIIRCNARIPPTALPGQIAQAGFVQFRLCDFAGTCAIGSAALATHTERRYAESTRMRQPCRTAGPTIRTIADQQNVALFEARLHQQLRGRIDRRIGALAIHRHHRWRQRVQKQRHIGRVFSERCNGEGFACIDQQRDFATGALAQQRGQFRARLQQARWRQIVGIDAGGQIQRHHQRHAGVIHRPLDLPPTRPGHCHHRKRIRQRSQHEAEPSALTTGDQ